MFSSLAVQNWKWGKIVFYILAVSSLVLFLILLQNEFRYFGFNIGWDAKVFCRAGNTLAQGANPYLLKELGGKQSWNYLPIYARFFLVACTRLKFTDNYVLLYMVLFIAGLLFWLKKKSWFYGVTLCLTGLYCLGWIIKTGNVGAVEFFFISLAALLLLKEKYGLSLFTLGLISSVKLFPLLYIPIWIGVIPNWKSRMYSIFWGAAGFLLPFFISAFRYSILFPWYFKQVLGLLPNRHAPIAEEGGLISPSLIYMVTDMFTLNLRPTMTLLTGFLLYLLVVVLLFAMKRTNALNMSNISKQEIFLAFGVVVVTLFMPRMKPYSFLPALLFFYVLTRQENDWRKSIFLLVLSLIPLLTYFGIQQSIPGLVSAWRPGILKTMISTIFAYHQTFFLLISTITFLFFQMSSQSTTSHEFSKSQP